MKILLALPLMALALFCVYGFLASGEASDPAEIFRWRLGYGVLGTGSLLLSLGLLIGLSNKDGDG